MHSSSGLVRFVAGEACFRVMSTVAKRYGGIYKEMKRRKRKEKISGQLLDRTD
jgi:hypothetical protein